MFSSDGYLFDISVERGRLSYLKDFATDLLEFGDWVNNIYLSIKGNQRFLPQVYDPIRAKSVEVSGILPKAMQPTSASHIAIFVWSISSMARYSDDEILSVFSGVITSLKFDLAIAESHEVHPISSEYGSAEKLTHFERDALQVVYEGNQAKYEQIYAPIWKDLAKRGFLEQSGILRKTYALTTKGDMARKVTPRH